MLLRILIILFRENLWTYKFAFQFASQYKKAEALTNIGKNFSICLNQDGLVLS